MSSSDGWKKAGSQHPVRPPEASGPVLSCKENEDCCQSRILIGIMSPEKDRRMAVKTAMQRMTHHRTCEQSHKVEERREEHHETHTENHITTVGPRAAKQKNNTLNKARLQRPMREWQWLKCGQESRQSLSGLRARKLWRNKEKIIKSTLRKWFEAKDDLQQENPAKAKQHKAK